MDRHSLIVVFILGEVVLQLLHKAKRCFYRYYQTVKTTNLKSLDTFKNKLSVIESYDIVIGTDPGLSKEELSGVANVTDIYKQAASEA